MNACPSSSLSISPPPALTATALPAGTLAPDFSLPHTNQDTIALSELRGQPVILAFTPPGWDPMRAEQMALFNEIVTQVQPHGARLLGLEVEGIWCDLDFAGSETLRFPLLQDFDPEGAVARAYGVYGERALFVIDAEGIIRWSQVIPAGLPPHGEDVLAALRAMNPDSLIPKDTSPVAVSKQAASFSLTRRNFMATALAASLALALGQDESLAQSFTGTPENSGTSKAANAAAGATVPVKLQVNGTTHQLNIEPRVSLLDALREGIGLTGTKKGCNQGACGACTVLIDGRRVNSCLTLAVIHEAESITTIEGLARGEQLHPVQAAFIEHDGFQCGYCTSGQILSGVACISEGHTGSEAEIREWMSGNICRCGAYMNIVAAIRAAAGHTAALPDLNGGQHESV